MPGACVCFPHPAACRNGLFQASVSISPGPSRRVRKALFLNACMKLSSPAVMIAAFCLRTKTGKKQKTYISSLPRRRHMKKRSKPNSGNSGKTRTKPRRISGKLNSRTTAGKSKSRSMAKRTMRSGVKKAVRSTHLRKPSRTSRKPGILSKKKASVSERTRSQPSKGGSMFMEPLEQVTVTCSSCNRKFSIVKIQNLKTEGMICQRCSVGEIQFPD